MRYQNQSLCELLLDREDGKGPSVSIRSQAYLDASSKYDVSTYSNLGLVRVANGTEFSAQAANPTVFSLGRAIKKDASIVEAIDAARFTGIFLIAGDANTAWGRLSWTDAGGARTANFKVAGTGVHGSGATFAFEAVGGAVFPVAAASQIDVTTGILTIAFNSSAFTESSVGLEITYDYDTVSESAYYGVTEAVMSQPMIQNRVIYVQAGDIGDDYVAGCEGQIKEDRVFMTGSNIGNMCRVTRYFYRDSTVPTKYTHSKSTMETVVAADLA